MWSNHVVTWVYADNSGMNLTLIFAFALYFAILFFVGFESEKPKSLYWYLE